MSEDGTTKIVFPITLCKNILSNQRENNLQR